MKEENKGQTSIISLDATIVESEWSRRKEIIFEVLYGSPDYVSNSVPLYRTVSERLYGNASKRADVSQMVMSKMKEGPITYDVDGIMYELQRFRRRALRLVEIEQRDC